MLRLALLCLIVIVGCGGSDDDEVDEDRYDELVSEVASRYTDDLGNPATPSHVRRIVEDTGRDSIEILEIMVDLPNSVGSVSEAAFLALAELGP